MKIVIIGGRLQGVEAAYLARKAGWQTVVVDIDKNAPAAGICDFFLNIDALNYPELARAIAGADFILPARENKEVLASCKKVRKTWAYRLSMMKGHTGYHLPNKSPINCLPLSVFPLPNHIRPAGSR